MNKFSWFLLLFILFSTLGVYANAHTPNVEEVKQAIQHRLQNIQSIQLDYTLITKDELGGPNSDFIQKYPVGEKSINRYLIHGTHPYYKKRLLLECTPDWQPINYKAFDGRTSQRVHPNGFIDEKEHMFPPFTEQPNPWWVIDRLTNHGRMDELLSCEQLKLEAAKEFIKLAGNIDQYSFAELILDPQKNYAIVEGTTGLRPEVLKRPRCHFKTFKVKQFEKVRIDGTDEYIPIHIRIEEHGHGDDRVTFSHTMHVFGFEINQNYPATYFDLVYPDFRTLGWGKTANSGIIDQLQQNIASLQNRSATTVQTIFSNTNPTDSSLNYKIIHTVADSSNVQVSNATQSNSLNYLYVVLILLTAVVGVGLYWLLRKPSN